MSRIYGKLEPTRAEIRVLTIDPDTIFDSPLQCSLRVVSLNDRPQFEALSYVWGEDSIKKTIAIDGDPWPVSVNLELALRYLRHSDAPRTLWVDAVCINQVDTDEKNFQIPLMSRIYSDCVNVIAWLGAANSNIEAAIAWAKRYVPDKSSSKMQPLDIDAEFPEEDSEQRNLAAFAVVDGIHALATSPYWARVWTFQEYRLAKEEPICVCGHLIFRASIFDVEGVGKLQLAVAGIVAYITKPSLQLHLSEDKKAITDAVGYFLMEVNHGGNKFSEHILCHLLQMTAKRRCSDDRDKVYGLYGMMPKAQKAYPADYRKPAKQVLLEASAYMINEELGASVFTYFPLRDGRLSDLSYPSWAPDLARAEINLQLKTVPPSLR
ncbi:HET-domain-containing protein, partial [Thozetella sp. PMI_491]